MTAKTWVLVAAVLGSSMSFVDATAVNVALPVLQRDLHAGAARVQWVVEGFALFLSALLLVGGALGDVAGRRQVFIGGIVLFALASLACALAPDVDVLIAARCVQGIGAAFMTPQSLALVSAAFTGDERGRAIGTWSGFAAIAGAAGPVIGGALAQAASWRWVFLLNAPVALVVIAIAWFKIADNDVAGERPDRSIDVAGAALATLALAGIVYGLIRLEARHGDPIGVATIGVGCAIGLAFALWERRARHPMLPWSIWNSRAFTAANLYTLLLYAALGGSLYFLPFVLVDVHGYPPAAAGAALLPLIVLQFAFSRWSGGLVARFGARGPLIVGALLAAAGFAALALPGADGSYWTTFFPAVLILGFGTVFFVAPLTTTVFDAAPPEHGGLASGVNNAVARTAGLVAIAAFGIGLSFAFDAAVDRTLAHVALAPTTATIVRDQKERMAGGTVPDGVVAADRPAVAHAIAVGLLDGFRAVMVLSTFVCLGAALVAFVSIPARVPHSGHTAAASSSA